LINEKKPVVEKIKNSLVNEVVIFTHGASFYNNNAFVNNNNMKKFIINTKQDHIDNKFHSIIMKIFNLVKTYLEDNNKKKCLYKQDIKSIIYLNMIMKRICYLYYIRIIIKNIEEDENYIIQKSDLSKITYMNDNIEQIFKDINSNKEKIRQNKIDKEKISELESNIQALEDYKILDDTLTVSKIQDIAIYLKNYKQNYKKNINTEEKILDKIPEKKIPNKKLQKTTGNQNFEKINNFGKDKQVGGDFREIEEDNFNMKNFLVTSNIFLFIPVIAALYVQESTYALIGFSACIFSPIYHYLRSNHSKHIKLLDTVRDLDWLSAVACYAYMYYFVITRVDPDYKKLLLLALSLTMVFFWYGFEFGNYRKTHPWFHITLSFVSLFIVILK
jgi:hypothetical protein